MPSLPKLKPEGITVPTWIGNIALKVLPYILIGIIGGVATMYNDTIENKKDISRNTWRNDQDDLRFKTVETRLTKNEDRMHDQEGRQMEANSEIIRLLKSMVREKEGNSRRN